MARYITNIHINELYHLSDFNIPIANDNAPHLIPTGKNGSGKTITLNAVADFLDKIKTDANLYFLQYQKWIDTEKKHLSMYPKNSIEYIQGLSSVKNYQKRYDNFIPGASCF